jgi:hypothetical protein
MKISIDKFKFLIKTLQEAHKAVTVLESKYWGFPDTGSRTKSSIGTTLNN